MSKLRGTLMWLLTGVAACALTGCFDRAELEEQAFLVTLGVDRVGHNLTMLTARVAVPSKLSGTSGSGSSAGGGEGGTPVVSATGRNMNEALLLMNAGIERSINLSHLSAVVFGERASKDGLLPYLRTLVRYREFRRTLYLFVARGNLSAVFDKDKPELEMSLTRYVEDLNSLGARTGIAPSTQVHQFLGDLEASHLDPVAPILALNRQVAKEKKKTTGSSSHLNGRTVSYQAGRIDRAGGNPVECIGTAVFRNDRMVGQFDGRETRYMRLLDRSLQRMMVVIPARGGGYLSLDVRYARPLDVRLILGARPLLQIRQSFEAELMGDQSAESFASHEERVRLEQMLARHIAAGEEKVIRKAFVQYGADPFGFFSYARGNFPDYGAMERYDWHAALKKTRVVISATANLRRLGVQLSPPVSS